MLVEIHLGRHPRAALPVLVDRELARPREGEGVGPHALGRVALHATDDDRSDPRLRRPHVGAGSFELDAQHGARRIHGAEDVLPAPGEQRRELGAVRSKRLGDPGHARRPQGRCKDFDEARQRDPLDIGEQVVKVEGDEQDGVSRAVHVPGGQDVFPEPGHVVYERVEGVGWRESEEGGEPVVADPGTGDEELVDPRRELGVRRHLDHDEPGAREGRGRIARPGVFHRRVRLREGKVHAAAPCRVACLRAAGRGRNVVDDVSVRLESDRDVVPGRIGSKHLGLARHRHHVVRRGEGG